MGVAALWWLLLVIGAILASNPPLLQAFLVERSDFVVEGILDSRNAQVLRVTECWKNPIRQKEDLCSSHPEISRELFPKEIPLEVGMKYLIPLKEIEGKLRWLNSRMYASGNPEGEGAKPPAAPVPSTDLTRLELRRALEEMRQPLVLDGVQLPQNRSGRPE